jgi:membrane fusion protein
MHDVRASAAAVRADVPPESQATGALIEAKVEPARLFRPESLRARQTAWIGEASIALGLPTAVTTIIAILLAAAMVALVTFETYARRVNLFGIVVPKGGLIEVSSTATGWIESLHVDDRALVDGGTLLYTLKLDTTTSNGETQAQVIRALIAQREILREEIARKQQIRAEQERTLASRVANLRQQVGQTGSEIEMQQTFERELNTDYVEFSGLVARSIATRTQRDTRRQSWMSAKSKLEELKSGKLRLEAQLIEAEYQLATDELQAAIEAQQIQVAKIDQQIADSEARQSIEIRSPGPGIATGVVGRTGQLVTIGTPLLTIVPEHADMQAELLAPSSAIGFIREGHRVLLRYSAFPYQKFGQYWGTVVDISRAAMPTQLQAVPASPSRAKERAKEDASRFYRVTVQLDSQEVKIYDRVETVPASMDVEGIVLLDERPLYQWIFEPLYGLHRSLTNT